MYDFNNDNDEKLGTLEIERGAEELWEMNDYH